MLLATALLLPGIAFAGDTPTQRNPFIKPSAALRARTVPARPAYTPPTAVHPQPGLPPLLLPPALTGNAAATASAPAASAPPAVDDGKALRNERKRACKASRLAPEQDVVFKAQGATTTVKVLVADASTRCLTAVDVDSAWLEVRRLNEANTVELTAATNDTPVERRAIATLVTPAGTLTVSVTQAAGKPEVPAKAALPEEKN